MLVLAGVLLSLGIVIRIANPRGAWGRRLRSRFFLGIPWGTLITIAGVTAFYLFVQGGLNHPYSPVVIPFRSWSYYYPLGIVTAPFAHAGFAHISGNLLGTLAFAPIAEYAWSHFPTERGTQSFSSWRTNPFVRILAVPFGAFVVGLLTGLFALGPVIGFSGVVFAFAGFALVTYPLALVVAFAGDQVLSLLFQSIRNPVSIAQAGPGFSSPWWAGIAYQGHVLGLLLGAGLGIAVQYWRADRTSAGRLWLGAVILTIGQGLWALYVPLGKGRYVLFRAGGAIVMFLLAALVTAAATASNRTLIDRINFRSREAAIGFFLSVLIAVSVVAVPVNLTTVSASPFDTSVHVQDYTVTYGENVQNQYVPHVKIPFFGEATSSTTSGVIVVSEQRSIFWPVVSKTRLAYSGRADVRVGGPGWRKTIVVNRTGWEAAGNSSVYKVFLKPPDGQPKLAFSSNATTVEPRIAGRRILLEPTDSAFELQVYDGNQSTGRTPMPVAGENVTAGGLRFNRTNRSVYAIRNGTRVRIARRRN
ncbi:MAG: rhomboid family intramembrane serine protease [Halorientalis sp.]